MVQVLADFRTLSLCCDVTVYLKEWHSIREISAFMDSWAWGLFDEREVHCVQRLQEITFYVIDFKVFYSRLYGTCQQDLRCATGVHAKKCLLFSVVSFE